MFNNIPFYVFAASTLTFGNSIVLSPASAQINVDGSTNTTLTTTNNVTRIEDGDRRY